MFAFLYRPAGGLEPENFASIGSGRLPDRRMWISPDQRVAAIWAAPAVMTESPAGDGRLAIAQGRLDLSPPGDVLAGGLLGRRLLFAPEATLLEFPGDIAALAWDPAQKELWLGTDHLGNRPVYYAATAQGMMAATALPDLLVLPGAPTALDGDSLVLLMAREMRMRENHTAFAGIKKLVGGHSVRLKMDSTARERRWWRPEEAPLLRFSDPREYTDALRGLFSAAVQARLPASGVVGGTLSGGLDSTLVLGYAASALAAEGREIAAFTSVPQPGLPVDERTGWEPSDWEYARKFASWHPNVRHEAFSADGACVLDTIREIGERAATPVRNSANHLWLFGIARRARQRGAHVVLTGERGNGTISFAGNGGLARLLRRGRLLSVLRHLDPLPAERRRRRLARTVLEAVTGDDVTMRLLQWGRIADYGNHGQLLRPEVRRALGAVRPAGGIGLGRRRNRVWFACRPHVSFMGDWPVLAGVEFRDPTGDRRLIEFLLRCPPEAFLDQGEERVQARWIGAGVVPDEIRFRQTRGEQCPEEAALVHLHADRYRELWSRLRRQPWLREVIEVSDVEQVLDRLARGEGTRSEAFDLHLIFNVGQFLETARRHWGATEIVHPRAALAGGRI